MLQVVCAAIVSAGVITFALALIGGEFRARWAQVIAALEMRDAAVTLDPIPPLARRQAPAMPGRARYRQVAASPLRLAA